MAIQRRQQIKQALAQNRPAQNKPQMGIGQGHPAQANIGLGGGRPAPQGPLGGAIGGNVGGMLGGGGVPAPLPWDSISTLESGSSQRRQGDTMSQIASERDRSERYYGIGEGYNVNNPYSQAAQLMAQHNAGRLGTVNAAGNQLYAGSTINHLRGVDNRYNVARNSLDERRADSLAGFQQGELRAQREGEEGAEDAQIGAIERAEQQPLEAAPGKKKIQPKQKQKARKK